VYGRFGLGLASITTSGLFVLAALLLSQWEWRLLTIAGILAAISIGVYSFTTRRNADVPKELTFTYIFFMVAIVAASAPTLLIPHRPTSAKPYFLEVIDTKEKVVNISEKVLSEKVPHCPGVSLTQEGTPCYFMFNSVPYFVDRFLLWEMVAIFETILFAILLLVELGLPDQDSRGRVSKLGKFNLWTVGFAVAGIIGSQAWILTDLSDWKAQVYGTILFAASIFLMDVGLWVVEKKNGAELRDQDKLRSGLREAIISILKQYEPNADPDFAAGNSREVAEALEWCEAAILSTGEQITTRVEEMYADMRRHQIELDYLNRVVWGVDLIMFLAISVIGFSALGLRMSGIENETGDTLLAQHFFAGGTALSFMFGNMSLVLLRAWKHRDSYRNLDKISFPAFIGLGRRDA
jgi:hypothetical protein